MFIPTPETISPTWLTEQLRRAGHEVDVRDYESRRIGTGQIGMCVRYTLDYEASEAAASAPKSLIVKYPSDDPTSRATGVLLKNFLKEVRFYQHLQDRLSIRTPRCLFAEIEGEGPTFAVLMEDLAPAEQGDQLLGCDASVANAAIQELVGLHAPAWCDQSLFAHDWLTDRGVDSLPGSENVSLNLYRDQLPGFLDRFGDQLEEDQRWIIARVAEVDQTPLNTQLPNPFSLVHVDYRLDNLLISAEAEPEITVVDWQSITVGAPLNDVAYFLGAGMLPPARREVEESIVRDYHRGLLAAGVSDFDWIDCWQAYRQGTFAGFAVTVIASMIVQRTERGDQMFAAMAQRHSRHALDLEAQEFLV